MMTLADRIQEFEHQFRSELAAAQTEEQLEQLRITFLGRSGQLTELMAILKDLGPEEKRLFGPKLNELKQQSLHALEEKEALFLHERIKAQQEKERHFDVTAYKPHQLFGSLHPYTHITREIEDIFITMGFSIVDGPEIETERNNFEALNIPKNHPARDLADTFWLEDANLLLRTHTSSVQAHIMQRQKPPIAIVAPGRTYRHEATDATHDFMFMQCEGLLIDKDISLNNLLATMRIFLQGLFNKEDLQIRTRPNFFPFVEPGIEIDMTCPFCRTGCSVCKKTGWVEICGAGLVHPNVLSFSGINPEEYSGFAFGFGLSRLTMLKYGIHDIRLLHSANRDFLKQF